MKQAWSQASQSAADAAVQRRILATGRLHDALTAHSLKARAYFLGLTETEQRKLARNFAARLGLIGQAAARARLLTHLGEIHGDLARRVARAFLNSSSPARLAPKVIGSPAPNAPVHIAQVLEPCEGAEG